MEKPSTKTIKWQNSKRINSISNMVIILFINLKLNKILNLTMKSQIKKGSALAFQVFAEKFQLHAIK
jgi:hypothetical protein